MLLLGFFSMSSVYHCFLDVPFVNIKGKVGRRWTKNSEWKETLRLELESNKYIYKKYTHTNKHKAREMFETKTEFTRR